MTNKKKSRQEYVGQQIPADFAKYRPSVGELLFSQKHF